jgi:hypothetical protein
MLKTSQRMRGALVAASPRVLAIAALAGACGGTTASPPSVGSESHFLAQCDATCADGLDCIGGICTRACLTSASDCSDLGANATCTDQSVEPGEVAVCDVGCSGTPDCQQLGSEYDCEGAFCRRSAASVQPIQSAPAEREVLCQPYFDQTPPPDVRGLSIVNEGTQVLYLEEFLLCSAEAGNGPSLVQVERDGEPLNTLGGGCAKSCEAAFYAGWSAQYDGEGRAAPDCPEIDCAGPRRVPIQPGETLFQQARPEIVFQRMPRACAEGAVTEAVNCYSRVIPPRGNYTLTVRASTASDSSVSPLVFSVPSEWPFDNQTLNVSAPILD